LKECDARKHKQGEAETGAMVAWRNKKGNKEEMLQRSKNVRLTL